MISQADMEELRQDMLQEDMECERHECLMLNDLDYFKSHSNYDKATEYIGLLKIDCELHDWDFNEVLRHLKEEL